MEFEEAINNLKKILVRYNTDQLCDNGVVKFYIHRNIEKNLEDIIKNNKFVMVQGVAGSGKTTLIKKAITNLYCNNEQKNKILYINVELDSTAHENYIEKIYYSVWNSAFLNKDKKRKDDIIKDFFSYFCKKGDMNRKQLNILNEISNETGHNKPCELCDKISNKDFIEYFWNHLADNSNYHLYLSHLINYFNYTMIVDNIDRLSSNRQVNLFKNLQDIASKIDINRGKIIFAIRQIKTWKKIGGGEMSINFNILDKKFITKDSFYKHKTPFIIIDKAINNINRSEDYKYISEINKQIKRSKFIEFNIFKYSNGSIRTTFLNLLDFYSWINNNIKDSSILNFSQTKINSLFLGWISLQEHIDELNGLNLSKVIHDMEEKNYMIVGCDTNLLLLTLIHNNSNGITYHGICEKFNRLDQSNKFRTNLKRILFHMYSIGRHQNLDEADYLNHIISIGDDAFVKGAEDIKDNTIFYINMKGKQLLIASLTFTYNNLQYYRTFLNKKDNNYFSENIDNRIEYNRLFLIRIIKVHLIELYKICLKYNSEIWLDEYLYDFGYIIEQQQNLQVVNIIEKTRQHFKVIKNNIKDYESCDKELQSISNKYEEEVQNIYNNIKQNKYMILDFKKFFIEGLEEYESIEEYIK